MKNHKLLLPSCISNEFFKCCTEESWYKIYRKPQIHLLTTHITWYSVHFQTLIAPSLLLDNNNLWFNLTDARERTESRWQPAGSVAAAARTAFVLIFVVVGRFLISCAQLRRERLTFVGRNIRHRESHQSKKLLTKNEITFTNPSRHVWNSEHTGIGAVDSSWLKGWEIGGS